MSNLNETLELKYLHKYTKEQKNSPESEPDFNSFNFTFKYNGKFWEIN